MGRRGPAGKDTDTLKRHGSYRADRHAGRDDVLQLPAVAPTPPADLNAEARAEWKRLASVLEGVLTEGDRAALTVLCELWSENQSLGRWLAKHDPGTSEWRRVCSARRAVRNQFVNLAARFGLTPADRCRVKVSHSPGGDDDRSKFFQPRLSR